MFEVDLVRNQQGGVTIQMRRGKYTFVPEYAIKSLDDATAKTYYGWEWDNILIVVGCLPSEVSLWLSSELVRCTGTYTDLTFT